MKTAAFSAAELRFGGWIPRAPDLSDFYAKGRGGLQPGASRDSVPPWGPPQSRPRRWEFRTAKRESRPHAWSLPRRSAKADAPPGLLHGEARKPTAPPGLLHGEVRKPTTAVAFARPRAFPAARPARTARFLITRGKASFYETATFGRRKVFFCSPFCGLLFGPTRAKLALPAGKKPAAPNPGRPAAARPTTATGSRF